MSQYEDIRFFPSRVRKHRHDLGYWNNIYHVIDRLRSPENGSIMDAIQREITTLHADYKDFHENAVSDFMIILRTHKTTLIEGYTLGEYDAVIHHYIDAVVIVEGHTRTVFWLEKGELCFKDLTPRLEIWLESGKKMKEWLDNEGEIPF